MNIYYIIHIILFLLLLLILFMPLKIQKYGLFIIPLIVSFLWIIFNDCPLNGLHKKEVENKYFLQSLLKLFNIDITKKLSRHIMTFIFILIPTLYCIRITYFKKFYKKI